jgi:hypothetical protein
MKRILIAGMFVTGISLVVTAIGAVLAPDLLDEPGGIIALFAAVFIAISGLFGGKISEWVDTIFGKKNVDEPIPVGNISQEVNEVKGGIVVGTIGTLNYTLPIQPEVHDTIGFIPAAKAVTYVHRGKIEDDVISFIRNGGSGAIVGVHAPGGLGKTELAKKTAETLQNE